MPGTKKKSVTKTSATKKSAKQTKTVVTGGGATQAEQLIDSAASVSSQPLAATKIESAAKKPKTATKVGKKKSKK